MDKLTQEVRKVLQSVALHGYDLICAEHDILKAMQTDHEAKLKEELLKFLKEYHTSMFVVDLGNASIDFEEIVDEYLKQRTNG